MSSQGSVASGVLVGRHHVVFDDDVGLSLIVRSWAVMVFATVGGADVRVAFDVPHGPIWQR